MRGVAPTSVHEIYETLPAIVANAVGATNHVVGIVEREELAAHVPGVMAYFSPFTQEVVVQPAITQSLDDLIAMPAGAGMSLQFAAQDEWKLKVTKANLVLLVGRVVQGVGPSDLHVARNEWHSLLVHRHVHSLVFGISELIAERIINYVIAELGLDVIAPQLLEIELITRRFVAQTQLVSEVLAEVARGRGTTADEELCILAREGSGQLAVWRLVERWGGHAEFGKPKRLHKPDALIELRRDLERNLTEMNEVWLNAA
jgi:hypothetical protein